MPRLMTTVLAEIIILGVFTGMLLRAGDDMYRTSRLRRPDALDRAMEANDKASKQFWLDKEIDDNS